MTQNETYREESYFHARKIHVHSQQMFLIINHILASAQLPEPGSSEPNKVI